MKHVKIYEEYSDDDLKNLMGDLRPSDTNTE